MTTSSSVVADRTAATGVAGSSPPAISSAAIAARWATPISTTIVPPTRGQRPPVDVGLAGPPVAGDHGERGGDAAVGDRDAGGGGGGDRRGDPGHDLERDAGLGQGEGLLAAAPEHERVAALQPHDAGGRPGQVDEQRR